jgi:CRISPR-associated protein Csx14
MTGRFGFDPAAAWEALDMGFSPDEQGVPVQTSPAPEILAAIGLQRCRPALTERKGRWFLYRAWSDPMEIAVAPAALAGVGSAIRAYEFPVLMRNAQYGSFGWARPWEDRR